MAIAGGVHIAALGGLWLMSVFGFAGLTLRRDGLGLDPRLPRAWSSLAFPVQWQGRHLRIAIDAIEQFVQVTLDRGEPMTVHIAGAPHALSAAQPLRVRWQGR
ncbi:glycosyl hydrolase family 65 protein [Phenylobacterium sp.]|uniref:glycosyl hydrolase family 65 protein n=1 Tax=Phenylobacterium sp. TaxID=1871053 RepID=UPI0025FEBE0F|nr:glycosyl hydrolase family 65 protein [Phenylobacterium sp.]